MAQAFAIAILILSSAIYAQDLLSNVSSPMSDLCSSLSSLLPVLAMLLTMAAAVIYVSGQLMGAETRARSNVWATAALTGAMMAVLIAVVSPPILSAVAGQPVSCDASGGGGGGPSASCPSNLGVACTFDPSVEKCCCSGTSSASCQLITAACPICIVS